MNLKEYIDLFTGEPVKVCVGRPFQRASSMVSKKALQAQSKSPIFTGDPDLYSTGVCANRRKSVMKTDGVNNLDNGKTR